MNPMIGRLHFHLVLAIFVIGCLLVLPARAAVSIPVQELEFQEPQPGDGNGSRVDISGDTIIVGGCYHDGDGSQGWAQVFVHDGDSWQWQDTLEVTGTSKFGSGVGIDGNTAIVGAHGSNKAYIFNRSGEDWIVEETSFDGISGFGYDTRIDGALAVVGTEDGPSAHYLTKGDNWVIGEHPIGTGASFGHSIDVSDSTAIVGDYDLNTVYFYDYDDDDWVSAGSDSGGSGDDRFGYSVAIDGNSAIVGADQRDYAGGSGFASIYQRQGNTWAEEVTLAPADLSAGDQFGSSVAISGNRAVVGAIGQGPPGQLSGTVHVFEKTDTGWHRLCKLWSSDGVTGDEFGNAVAIEGNWIVVGAWWKDDDTGAAYVFNVPSPLIPGDANLDGQVDGQDAAILADSWGVASGAMWVDGDFDGDECVGPRDAAILAAHWGEGTGQEASAVPEPSQLVLLAGLLFMLASVRRR